MRSLFQTCRRLGCAWRSGTVLVPSPAVTVTDHQAASCLTPIYRSRQKKKNPDSPLFICCILTNATQCCDGEATSLSGDLVSPDRWLSQGVKKSFSRCPRSSAPCLEMIDVSAAMLCFPNGASHFQKCRFSPLGCLKGSHQLLGLKKKEKVPDWLLTQGGSSCCSTLECQHLSGFFTTDTFPLELKKNLDQFIFHNCDWVLFMSLLRVCSGFSFYLNRV